MPKQLELDFSPKWERLHLCRPPEPSEDEIKFLKEYCTEEEFNNYIKYVVSDRVGLVKFV